MTRVRLATTYFLVGLSLAALLVLAAGIAAAQRTGSGMLGESSAVKVCILLLMVANVGIGVQGLVPLLQRRRDRRGAGQAPCGRSGTISDLR